MMKRYTLNHLYTDIVDQFGQVGTDSPKLDARLLISAALGLSESDFILKRSEEISLSEQSADRLNDYVARRCAHEPVSKILGKKAFWTHEFDVTTDVLDPRPDSEIMIEAILNYIKAFYSSEQPMLRILELGVGSGALICTLLSECKNAAGVGVDISTKALEVTQRNAQALGMDKRLTLLEGSWLDPLVGNDNILPFDIVLSNPPYIPSADIESLSIDVQQYDPILALDGGEDGLNPYREILENVDKVIHPHGRIFFEFGANQKSDLSRIVEDYGFAILETHKDLSGKDRVVSIAYGEK